MKAQAMWSKFVLKSALDNKKKQLDTDLRRLRKESRFHSRVRKMSFPCEVRYDICGAAVTFRPPSGGWKDDHEFHKTLAYVHRQFDIRMERHFDEYDGGYYWQGTTKDKHTVLLYGAVKPEACEIVPYTTEITKYKSICTKADNKIAA